MCSISDSRWSRIRLPSGEAWSSGQEDSTSILYLKKLGNEEQIKSKASKQANKPKSYIPMKSSVQWKAEEFIKMNRPKVGSDRVCWGGARLSSTWETETGRSWVQDQPGLHNKVLFQKTPKQWNNQFFENISKIDEPLGGLIRKKRKHGFPVSGIVLVSFLWL
jgi:hypothetical protein